MCNSRNSTKTWKNKKAEIVKVDKCLAYLITLINTQTKFKTLSCCCGHNIYPMTIIVKDLDGLIFELMHHIIIPRKRRFYLKDKKGYYYIPEVIKQ